MRIWVFVPLQVEQISSWESACRRTKSLVSKRKTANPKGGRSAY